MQRLAPGDPCRAGYGKQKDYQPGTAVQALKGPFMLGMCASQPHARPAIYHGHSISDAQRPEGRLHIALSVLPW
jgi:hypothetical protein